MLIFQVLNARLNKITSCWSDPQVSEPESGFSVPFPFQHEMNPHGFHVLGTLNESNLLCPEQFTLLLISNVNLDLSCV